LVERRQRVLPGFWKGEALCSALSRERRLARAESWTAARPE
jgi:hypothetical protein